MSDQSNSHNPATPVVTLVSTQKDRLRQELFNAIRAQAFQNRYTVHPRRFQKTAEEAVETFQHYIETDSVEEAESWGKALAAHGFGDLTLLTILTTIRRFFLDSCDSRFHMTYDGFCTTVLHGFCTELEYQVLKEQERTRIAYMKVLEQQQSKK